MDDLDKEAIRNNVLEEAAKVADEHERSYPLNLGWFQGPDRFDIARAETCRAVADDIRALKSPDAKVTP